MQALPYLARIPPGLAITEGGAITLPKQDVLSAAGYPWSAEAIAEFVGDRCGLAVGEIKRPQLISSRLMPVVGLGALAALGAVAYRLYHAPFMRHQALYALGALAVYWFSVSGAPGWGPGALRRRGGASAAWPDGPQGGGRPGAAGQRRAACTATLPLTCAHACAAAAPVA